MKTSHIYVMLLSVLVVQISSETSDLEKTLSSLLKSSFDLIGEPIHDLINAAPMRSDAEQFLKEFSWKLKVFMERSQKELFGLIPKGERENTEKLIGYSSMYVSGAFSDAKRLVSNMSNQSFETLPDNIKTKILDIGNDINDYLKKLRADMNGSKTS